MHFQGQLLISQATHVSNRSLVTVALAQIFAVWFEVNTSDLEVLGLKLGDAFTSIAPVMIAFLAVNHLLSWWADYRSFQAWNSPGKVAAAKTWGFGGSSLHSKLEDALGGMKKLDSKVEHIVEITTALDQQNDDAELARRLEQFKISTDELTSTLNSLLIRTERLSLHAKTYLWGWYLLLPTGLAGYALSLALMV